jgi:hypothetical protein
MALIDAWESLQNLSRRLHPFPNEVCDLGLFACSTRDRLQNRPGILHP